MDPLEVAYILARRELIVSGTDDNPFVRTAKEIERCRLTGETFKADHLETVEVMAAIYSTPNVEPINEYRYDLLSMCPKEFFSEDRMPEVGTQFAREELAHLVNTLVDNKWNFDVPRDRGRQVFIHDFHEGYFRHVFDMYGILDAYPGRGNWMYMNAVLEEYGAETISPCHAELCARDLFVESKLPVPHPVADEVPVYK